MIEAGQRPEDRAIRLHLEHFQDGWGWRTWEERSGGEWRPLRPPAAENRQRRFHTPQDAERFFHLLAEFISETATEYVSARCVVPWDV